MRNLIKKRGDYLVETNIVLKELALVFFYASVVIVSTAFTIGFIIFINLAMAL